MRLKASIVFAGAITAVTTMAASPALACSDRDPALQLKGQCADNGVSWMVTNPNTWGSVPFTWTDDKGRGSQDYIQAPPGGSVAVPTNASKIMIKAFRPDKRRGTVWQNHGAVGTLHCDRKPSPSPTPSSTPTHSKPMPAPTTVKPTKTVPPPAGEAGPATPVKAQPQFTG
jgi:hypothetical protein